MTIWTYDATHGFLVLECQKLFISGQGNHLTCSQVTMPFLEVFEQVIVFGCLGKYLAFTFKPYERILSEDIWKVH